MGYKICPREIAASNSFSGAFFFFPCRAVEEDPLTALAL